MRHGDTCADRRLEDLPAGSSRCLGIATSRPPQSFVEVPVPRPFRVAPARRMIPGRERQRVALRIVGLVIGRYADVADELAGGRRQIHLGE